MSRNTALAHAARRARALAERLPERHRPPVAEAWGMLLEDISDMSDKAAIEAVEDWLHEIELACSMRTLHLPLDGKAA